MRIADGPQSQRQPNKSPIEEAHFSTTLVHLANASYRSGTLTIRPATTHAVSDEKANTLLRGTDRALYIVSEQI
jgi:hypothetical protein